jgi:hypothetical protein
LYGFSASTAKTRALTWPGRRSNFILRSSANAVNLLGKSGGGLEMRR